MDFEQIKKLLELGNGRCAIYEEGKTGYVVMNAVEFDQFAEVLRGRGLPPQNNPAPQTYPADENFFIEEAPLEDIKIEDLPL